MDLVILVVFSSFNHSVTLCFKAVKCRRNVNVESSANMPRAWGGEGKVWLEAKYLHTLGTQPGSAGCEQWGQQEVPPSLGAVSVSGSWRSPGGATCSFHLSPLIADVLI